jgi:DNA-binding response OmpR family regulator
VKRILIVDDDIDLCELLVALYQSPGQVECESAHRFDEVREKFRNPDFFDLIILDLNLGPGQPDGIAIHAWLGQQNFRGQIVFLTGHGRYHPTLEKICAAHGNLILEKPAGVSTLKSLIEGIRTR